MVGSQDLPPSTASFGSVFYHNQFRAKPKWPSPGTDLSGKTAIVTGGNTGLGLEAARQLLGLKLSRLILAVRTPSKGELAAEALRRELSGHAGAAPTIDVWQLDMCSYESVQSFARRVEANLPRVDYVLLNAGLGRTSYRAVPATGHEETLQVNYLSTALLAILLLPVLKAKKQHHSSPPPHVTITGAALALAAALPSKSPILPALDDPAAFKRPDTYQTSKLLGHMLLWKLSEFVSADDVVVNIADPAFVRGTGLWGGGEGWFAKPVKGIASRLIARSLPDGASCLVDALVSKGRESHGCFLMSWEIHPFASLLYTPEGEKITQRVWDETMSELEFAGARRIVESMRSA